jgi:hypothetical protein
MPQTKMYNVVQYINWRRIFSRIAKEEIHLKYIAYEEMICEAIDFTQVINLP